MLRLVFVLSFSFLMSPLYAASFDCNKATTETEKAICADPELNDKDALLGKSLQKLLEKFSEDKSSIIQSQREWIKTQSSCKGNLDCLNWMYDHWFSQYTWNMSFADAGTIKIPDLKQNAVHFDARTCEFLNKNQRLTIFVPHLF